MTPAERLSLAKPRKRPARNRGRRHGVWDCRLREKRESLNLSMRDVAAAVGVSVTTMHQVELGGDPQLTTAYKLAAFFGCPVELLWGPTSAPRKAAVVS